MREIWQKVVSVIEALWLDRRRLACGLLGAILLATAALLWSPVGVPRPDDPRFVVRAEPGVASFPSGYTATVFGSVAVAKEPTEEQDDEESGGPLSGPADWATDLIEATGYPGVAVLVALTNVLPPVPVELVLLVAGFVAGEERLWFPAVVTAATVGSLGGALALYAAGYWLGEERLRRFVKRYGRFLLLKEADLDRANHWFDRHGGKAVLFGRMVPGLRKVVPIPAGVARMPLERFLTYTAIGSLFVNSVLVGLGWVLGDQWVAVRPYAHLLQYGLLIAVAAAVLWFVWNRWSTRGG